MATAQPYRYFPLSSDKPEIRLATLYPGQFSDDITISLSDHAFSESNKPTYEALSYAWGSTENPETVVIRDSNDLFPQTSPDKDSEGPELSKALLITQNLSSALRHLRLPDKPRVLWVDSLSINQSDQQERSMEVGRMGEIYTSAENVLVWLGPATDDSDVAIQMVESFSAGISIHNVYFIKTVPGSQADTYYCYPQTALDKNPSEFTALRNLLQRPWFSRLWVRQEVFLARKPVVILGYSKILWDDLEKIAILLYDSHSRSPEAWDVEELYRLRTIFLKDQGSLENLLQTSSHAKYSNPRDIVYANLSMSIEFKWINIQPDYEKPAATAYKDLFFKYLQKFKVTSLMNLCDTKHRLLGMPSFIPDFSIPKPKSTRISCAAGRSVQTRNFKEADRLILDGVFITTVSRVYERIRPTSNMSEMLDVCHIWEPDHLKDALYCNGGSLLDAYISTLSGSFGKDSRATSSAADETRKQFLATVWSGSAYKHSRDQASGWYPQVVGSNLRGSSFFESQDGHIGVSSTNLKAGDRICVFLGGNIPFILRPLPENSALNEIVGTCYLHGVMFGEALLGPIPPPWICCQDQKSLRWHFVNTISGKQTFRDPRLGRLPSGWELHYCDITSSCIGDCQEAIEETDYVPLWFYNLLTKWRYTYDPRLSVDNLKKRGIAIEEIVLV